MHFYGEMRRQSFQEFEYYSDDDLFLHTISEGLHESMTTTMEASAKFDSLMRSLDYKASTARLAGESRASSPRSTGHLHSDSERKASSARSTNHNEVSSESRQSGGVPLARSGIQTPRSCYSRGCKVSSARSSESRQSGGVPSPRSGIQTPRSCHSRSCKVSESQTFVAGPKTNPLSITCGEGLVEPLQRQEDRCESFVSEVTCRENSMEALDDTNLPSKGKPSVGLGLEAAGDLREQHISRKSSQSWQLRPSRGQSSSADTIIRSVGGQAPPSTDRSGTRTLDYFHFDNGADFAQKEKAYQDEIEKLNSRIKQYEETYGALVKQISLLEAQLQEKGYAKPSGTMMDPPEHLICPITLQVFNDPVVAADGQSYERFAIQSWLAQSSQSPLHGLYLSSQILYPNRNLKQQIEALLEDRMLSSSQQFQETSQQMRKVALSIASATATHESASSKYFRENSISSPSFVNYYEGATMMMPPQYQQQHPQVAPQLLMAAGYGNPFNIPAQVTDLGNVRAADVQYLLDDLGRQPPPQQQMLQSHPRTRHRSLSRSYSRSLSLSRHRQPNQNHSRHRKRRFHSNQLRFRERPPSESGEMSETEMTSGWGPGIFPKKSQRYLQNGESVEVDYDTSGNSSTNELHHSSARSSRLSNNRTGAFDTLTTKSTAWTQNNNTGSFGDRNQQQQSLKTGGPNQSSQHISPRHVSSITPGNHTARSQKSILTGRHSSQQQVQTTIESPASSHNVINVVVPRNNRTCCIL